MDSYKALKQALSKWLEDNPELSEKDWNKLAQPIKDDYIEEQMEAYGYERGEYIGHGTYKWIKKGPKQEEEKSEMSVPDKVHWIKDFFDKTKLLNNAMEKGEGYRLNQKEMEDFKTYLSLVVSGQTPISEKFSKLMLGLPPKKRYDLVKKSYELLKPYFAKSPKEILSKGQGFGDLKKLDLYMEEEGVLLPKTAGLGRKP